MKNSKTNLLKSLFSVLLIICIFATVFTGCEKEPAIIDSEGFSFNGVIRFDEKEFPDFAEKNSVGNVRSISASVPSAICYAIVPFSEKGNTPKIDSAKLVDTGSFSILVPNGKWYLKIYAYDSALHTPDLNIESIQSESFASGTTEAIEIDGEDYNGLSVVLTPLQKGQGQIKAELNFEENSPVKYVRYKAASYDEETAVVNKKAILDFDGNTFDAATKSYEIEIHFEDENKVDLLVLKENARVYPNLVSGKWVENSHSAFIQNGIFTVPNSIFATRTVYYVDPEKGSEKGSGSAAAPLNDINTALEKIREKDIPEATIKIKSGTTVYINSYNVINSKLTIEPYEEIEGLLSEVVIARADSYSSDAMFTVANSADRSGDLTVKNLTIDGMNIESTQKGHNGGAFSVMTLAEYPDTKANLVLENCKIKNHKLLNCSGAAIGTDGLRSYVTIKNSYIENNSSQKKGGAIYNSGSVEIENTQIKNNYSQDNGGGIYHTGSKLKLTGKNFIESNENAASKDNEANENNLYIDNSVANLTIECGNLGNSDDHSNIGISTASDEYPVVFTSNYAANNYLPPSEVFFSDFNEDHRGEISWNSTSAEAVLTVMATISGGIEDILGDRIVFEANESVLNGTLQNITIYAYKGSAGSGTTQHCTEWSAKITDIHGVEVVPEKTLEAGTHITLDIDSSTWPAGTYLLKVEAYYNNAPDSATINLRKD